MLVMPKEMRTSQSSRRLSVTNSTAAAAGGVGGTRATSSWSVQDDDQLIQARASGLNWHQISPRYFPTKTANACRKRHERLMDRRTEENLGGIKFEALATAYMQVREQMWKILAERMGDGKWQTVELKCMEMGLKNLTQAYRSAQRKQGIITHGHDDSGIGCSDFEDEIDHPPSAVSETPSHPLAAGPVLHSTPSQVHHPAHPHPHHQHPYPSRSAHMSVNSILTHPQSYPSQQS